MNIQEYYNIIEKTAKYPQVVNDYGKSYTIDGILDELDELSEATTREQAISESGDVMWYIAATCKELGLSLEELITDRQKHTKVSPIKLLGIKKKYHRDGKPINLEVVSNILKMILDDLILDAQDADITLEEILETNYNKLIERHATGTIQGDGESVEERLNNKS